MANKDRFGTEPEGFTVSCLANDHRFVAVLHQPADADAVLTAPTEDVALAGLEAGGTVEAFGKSFTVLDRPFEHSECGCLTRIEMAAPEQSPEEDH